MNAEEYATMRRFALLQAAATLYAAEGRIGSRESRVSVVDEAIALLGEIEKREVEP